MSASRVDEIYTVSLADQRDVAEPARDLAPRQNTLQTAAVVTVRYGRL